MGHAVQLLHREGAIPSGPGRRRRWPGASRPRYHNGEGEARAAGCTVFVSLPSQSWGGFFAGTAVLALGVGAIVGAVYAGRRKVVPVFHVILTLASGQVLTLVVRDEEAFQKLHAAVLEATGKG
jgi:hypothetical protein